VTNFDNLLLLLYWHNWDMQ